MDSTPVIIVGAGPSGLVLALNLAMYKIKSVILEREETITDDPRGVYLSGDSVRVLWTLGIQEELAKIGHEQTGVQFHKASLTNPAFIKMDTQTDWRQQVVPDSIMQIQPELERTLRNKLADSEYCELRCGCEVTSIEELDNGMMVRYRTSQGQTQHLKGTWLVGADGKRGYVRKHYLEPVAGVQQEKGLFAYEGTWVAANLHIKLPTPDTHPDLSVWAAGMTPEEVYDLFWPAHLHFVSPPGKPTASMRFGPTADRLWRHEFAQPDWHDSMDAEKLLWEHLLPMVTREQDSKGRRFPKTVYPQDCIEIRRCAPYAFAQKVANKWFHNRTIIVGDAAHVFPPFGGQGITSGIRDAQGLAWRLAMFEQMPNLKMSTVEEQLSAWSLERKQAIDDSARLTKANGDLANMEEKWIHALLRNCVAAIESISVLPHIPTEAERAEREAYSPAEGGFFQRDQHGGYKAAQIYVKQHGEPPVLSDELLKHDRSLMTLIMLSGDSRLEVEGMLDRLSLPEAIISKQSIVEVDCTQKAGDAAHVFHPCSAVDLPGKAIKTGYRCDAYADRLGHGTKFAIVRPDFIVYSAAKTLSGLESSLKHLRERLSS